MHTPGPWLAVKFEIPGHVFWCPVSRKGKLTEKGEEGRANAHLIAAAPDLLEALKRTLEHVEDESLQRVNGQCTLCHSYRAMIRAAIAKAEGRS